MSFRPDFGATDYGKTDGYFGTHKNLNDQMTDEERAIAREAAYNGTADPKFAPGSLAVASLNDGIEQVSQADAFEIEAAALYRTAE